MSLIPPFFLDCVVAIGFSRPGGRVYCATGFLYGLLLATSGELKTYGIFLVTNRHVFRDERSAWLRFDVEGNGEPAEAELQLLTDAGEPRWLAHRKSDVDLAAIQLNVGYLADHHIHYGFFRSDQHILSSAEIDKPHLCEGDAVFVLGFPLGLVGKKRNFAIVRQGTVARVRDGRDTYLVDAGIFPGNSGGPVVTKPEFVSIRGTEPIRQAKLAGVVSGYVPYEDVAVSQQTGRPRVIFSENSGLAEVITVDRLSEMITETAANPATAGEAPVEAPAVPPEAPSVPSEARSLARDPGAVPADSPTT